MLQTYEAIMQPNWGLQFSDVAPPKFDQAQKVLVTLLPNPDLLADTKQVLTDWPQVTGLLKNSVIFGDDPMAIQQGMRNEWR